MLRAVNARAFRLALVLPLLVSVLSCARTQRTNAQGAAQSPAQPGQSLEQLRADYAARFMEPAPHMALARYFRDKGDRLQAFYILEAARRGRFEEEEFNRAFAEWFRGEKPVDASAEAEAALLEEHARDPNSVETITKLADIYITREDWAKAKQFIAQAIRLKPDDYENTDAMAQVLEREGNTAEADRVRAEYVRLHPETAEGYRERIGAAWDKEPARAKALVAEASKKFPGDAVFVFDTGVLLQRDGKLREAEDQFTRAAKLAPDSDYIQARVAKFFYKARNDNARALDYYLSAYLLNPHSYEGEYVESRIQRISGEAAEAKLDEQTRRGAPLTALLNDPNPSVAIVALEKMGGAWKPEYMQPALAALSHDDGGVRWTAMEAIKKNANRSFDPTLRSLLADADLRKRGLALYLAAHLWGRESFPFIREALGEQSQLLRFDAVSALFIEAGAEGRVLVAEHLPREPNERLKKLIESGLKEPPGGGEQATPTN